MSLLEPDFDVVEAYFEGLVSVSWICSSALFFDSVLSTCYFSVIWALNPAPKP